MTRDPEFRKDLFRGTAEFYDRFRPPYPSALLYELVARVPNRGRMLDLACGTGQIAFAAGNHFDEVWAVDQEPEFIAFVAAKAERLGWPIHGVVGSAEEAELPVMFDLVAIGNVFHRLRRQVVADRLARHLNPNGCVALLWGGVPWDEERPWQQTMRELIGRWTDRVAADRVPPGWQEAIDADPHQRVLERAGLVYEGRVDVTVHTRWSIESLAGFAYSSSILSHEALGDRVPEFEMDVRATLEPYQGDLEQDASFAFELARRPA